jgi:hypothetical protein
LDAGLIGALAGLIGAGAGVCVALYATGFFQYLGGKKQPARQPVSKRELLDKILTLNDPSKPYHIVKGVDTDLIAEWKIVDAKWYGILNKSGLKEAYRALLLLDEARHAVRCYEELGSVTWTAGLRGLLPGVSYQRRFFRGRILYGKEQAKGYGLRQLKPPEPGKVYDYQFDVNEIRGPIILILPRLKPVGFSSHSRRLHGSHTARVLGIINEPPASWASSP